MNIALYETIVAHGGAGMLACILLGIGYLSCLVATEGREHRREDRWRD